MPETHQLSISTHSVWENAAPQWLFVIDFRTGVTNTHAGSHAATAEVPHKADQIAAAPRTEQVCQNRS
jgi:hypothetical protein